MDDTDPGMDVRQFMSKVINPALNEIIALLSTASQEWSIYIRMKHPELEYYGKDRYTIIREKLLKWKESIYKLSESGLLNKEKTKIILKDLVKIIAYTQHYVEEEEYREKIVEKLWSLARKIQSYTGLNYSEELKIIFRNEISRLEERTRKTIKASQNTPLVHREKHDKTISQELPQDKKTKKRVEEYTIVKVSVSRKKKASYLLIILIALAASTYILYDTNSLPQSLMQNQLLRNYHDAISNLFNKITGKEKLQEPTTTSTHAIETVTQQNEHTQTTISTETTTTITNETTSTLTTSTSESQNNYDYLLLKLEEYLNDNRTIKVGETILGDTENLTSSEIVWRILEWEEKNMEYDYEKAATINNETNPEYQSPWDTLERKKGICIDYAILTVALLSYANITPSYIITYDEINHAVAMTNINNTYFILDQHLPPIEAIDYRLYMIENSTQESKLYVITKTNNTINVYKQDPQGILSQQTGYIPKPEDYNSLLTIITGYIEQQTISQADDKLNNFIQHNVNTIYYERYLKSLMNEKKISILYFYNPVFKNEWSRYLADSLIHSIKELNTTRYFWLNTTSTMTINVRLAIAVTNLTLPIVKTYYESPDPFTLLYVIKMDSNETINNLKLLIYSRDMSEPIGGITDSEHQYTNIFSITAETWIQHDKDATIKINTEDLNNTLPPGTYKLVIWVNNEVAHILPLDIPIEKK